MATINGTAGNDNLSGTAADDIINGLAGDDTLYGGDGTDTYLFSAGWGKDIIDNQDFSNSPDAIVFDATVDVSDIAVSWSIATLS